jgi:DNA-binding CsgD family transcriptional regulator
VGYRNDTVTENDNLTFLSDTPGNGILGKGEKWENPNKAFFCLLLAIFLPLLALVVCAFLIFRNRTLKLAKLIQEAAEQSVKAAPDIDLESMELSDREEEICELLLTDRPLKEIAAVLKLSYPGATHRAQNLYKKLGIENRTELLVRVKK